jgi:hypothetical protein
VLEGRTDLAHERSSGGASLARRAIGEEAPEELPELQRFFQDYMVLEGKEVDVGDFSSAEEAVGAVRHAMDLYEKHFAATR